MLTTIKTETIFEKKDEISAKMFYYAAFKRNYCHGICSNVTKDDEHIHVHIRVPIDDRNSVKALQKIDRAYKDAQMWCDMISMCMTFA